MEINKTNWKPFKLIDVVTKMEENDRENAKNRFDRFLKVDHMDAESLHIKRWSSQKDGDEINPYFYKIFRKGQLLFPTRNPHLKRTAIASFDGITGEKTLTLKPNENLLVNGFIPFLFHSESFYKHTTNAIIGSTNPHVRWRDVANYQFLLPPKEEQERLSELLWSIDELIENEIKMLNWLKKSDLAYLKNYFFDNKATNRVKLKEIVAIKKGKQPSILSSDGNGVPYCKAKYLRFGIIEEVVPEELLANSTLIEDNDIVVLWDGASGEIFKGKKGVLASTMSKLSVINKKFLRDYLFEFLRFRSASISRTSVGSVIKHVDPTYFNNIQVPELSIDEQEFIINLFDTVRKNIENLEIKIDKSKSLQKSIINQIF
jgi:type I restriction enzyme S subunit